MTRVRLILLLAIFSVITGAGYAGDVLALDANSNGNNGAQGSSMDEVARMIRQTSRWQILEASPRKKGSVTRYRFKLISNSGKVKIISIDPKRPNLRKLEQ